MDIAYKMDTFRTGKVQDIFPTFTDFWKSRLIETGKKYKKRGLSGSWLQFVSSETNFEK